jgi:tetratricopeptide (TPR) repeat protein
LSPKLRAERASSLLLVAVLVLGTFAVPAAADEDPDCQVKFREALKWIDKAERTSDADAARRAVDWLKACERLCPENAWYPLHSGLAHVLARDRIGADEALFRLRALLEARVRELNRPEASVEADAKVLFLRSAINLYLAQNPGLAVKQLQRARAYDPSFPYVNSMLYRALLAHAGLLAGDQKWSEAIAQTRLAIAETRGDPDSRRRDIALRNLAQLHRFAENHELALPIMEDLAKRYPKDAVIRYGLAGTYADMFRWDPAAREWAVALQLIAEGGLKPEEAEGISDARMRYGVTLVRAQRWDDGEKELRGYLEDHKQDARVHRHLGELLFEHYERYEDAIVFLEKARDLDPWCEQTLRDLLQAYSRAPRPNLEKANEYARKSREIDAVLLDETQIEARKKERERRQRVRLDHRDGCT